MHTSRSIAQSLAHALERGADPKHVAERVKNIFLKSSRSSQLPQIIYFLEQFREKQEAEAVCQVETAGDLSKEVARSIADSFGAEEVRVVQDEALLGGYRVFYKGLLYDGTLGTRLATLRKNIVN